MSSGNKTEKSAASSTGQPTRKFFFDISGLVDFLQRNAHYSGIQRVVSEVVSEFASTVPSDQVYVTFSDAQGTQLKCLPFDALSVETLTDAALARRFFHPRRPAIGPIPQLRKYRNRKAEYLYHRTRLDLLAWLGKDQKFRKYGLTAADWKDIRSNKNIDVIVNHSADSLENVARAGDCLIVLDFSSRPGHLDAYDAAKALGLATFVFVHDLIPLIRPELCPEDAPIRFRGWLESVTALADGILVNSEATAHDLKVYLAHRNVALPITVIPLTQTKLGRAAATWRDDDISAMSPQYISLSKEQREVLTRPFVLCVGTIEARKNNWRVLMAWKSLLDSGNYSLPKLVFAGKPGILRKDFESAMRATRNLLGYAQIIETPDDAVLDLLYRRCDFAIAASLYEGWGLPVGEALAYGKTAVVSQTSSLPEVGMDLVEYCDPNDVSSIARAINQLQNPDHRAALEQRIQERDLRNWRDVAHDILAATHQ